MNRRGFCINACQAASLVALGTLFESCGGNPASPSDEPTSELTRVSGTVANNVVTVSLGTSPLTTVGGLALVQAGSGSFLTARVSQDTINVMTSTCTHEGCSIHQFNGPVFQCDCHGSQFTTSGGVARGPAAQSLRRFNATLSANVLSFSL